MAGKIFQHKIERSSASHAILESSSRKRKAAKIKAVLEQVTDFSQANVLDIGTGSGHIAHEFSKSAKGVSSVDIVDERKETAGYTFKLASDEILPFDDNEFDIVITNHVVEHTPDQKKHLEEVLRVLKPGGYIYLATPNKFWPTDPHYKLPFISWLPRRVSSAYLNITQKAKWDIYPLSSRGVKAHLAKHDVSNALPILLRTEAAKKLDIWKPAVRIARFVPERLLSMTDLFSPTLIYVIQKADS